MSWFSKVFSTGIDKTLGTVFKGIDDLSTSKEEKATLRSQAVQNAMSNQANARELYKTDSSLQKIFAIVFLIGYIALSVMMLIGIYETITDNVTFNNVSVSIVTMLFTAMSNKINTITDFLFGGSQAVKDPLRKQE